MNDSAVPGEVALEYSTFVEILQNVLIRNRLYVCRETPDRYARNLETLRGDLRRAHPLALIRLAIGEVLLDEERVRDDDRKLEMQPERNPERNSPFIVDWEGIARSSTQSGIPIFVWDRGVGPYLIEGQAERYLLDWR